MGQVNSEGRARAILAAHAPTDLQALLDDKAELVDRERKLEEMLRGLAKQFKGLVEYSSDGLDDGMEDALLELWDQAQALLEEVDCVSGD